MTGLGWSAFWLAWTVGGAVLMLRTAFGGVAILDRGWGWIATIGFVLAAGPVLWGALLALLLERFR